mmetsp:Transcript_4270/g.16338  ORF Transcript_4270/g.16338 Transcript_4270/m.16338 type:complete len:296 (-) Transcript_4270:173-1060(-)
MRRWSPSGVALAAASSGAGRFASGSSSSPPVGSVPVVISTAGFVPSVCLSASSIATSLPSAEATKSSVDSRDRFTLKTNFGFPSASSGCCICACRSFAAARMASNSSDTSCSVGILVSFGQGRSYVFVSMGSFASSSGGSSSSSLSASASYVPSTTALCKSSFVTKSRIGSPSGNALASMVCMTSTALNAARRTPIMYPSRNVSCASCGSADSSNKPRAASRRFIASRTSSIDIGCRIVSCSCPPWYSNANCPGVPVFAPRLELGLGRYTNPSSSSSKHSQISFERFKTSSSPSS